MVLLLKVKVNSSTVQHLRKPIDLPLSRSRLPLSISPISTCCHLFFFPTTPQIEHSAALQIITRQQSGTATYRERGMSRGSSGGRGLDLKLNLNLSPPPARGGERTSESESESSPSSCLSSEGEREHGHGLQWSDSPEATSMVLAACPRCLMYVMLSEADPRCPRCLSPVLLDFLHRAAGTGSLNAAGGRRNRRA